MANLTPAWSAEWQLIALGMGTRLPWSWGSWELGSSNVSKPKKTLPSPSHLKDIFKVLQKPPLHLLFFLGLSEIAAFLMW